MIKIFRRILLAAGMALATASVQAQPQSVRMTAGRTAEGLVYFLPKTAVRFHLLVEKKTYTPGDFAQYAEKYLHLQQVQQEQETSYSLVGYTVTPFGVRDTSKCYSVRMKGGKCETAEVKLSDDGVLLAINDKPLQPRLRAPFKAAPRAAQQDPRRYLPAEMLIAGSTAKMAELTAQLIYELQERRLMLISGEAEDMPENEDQLRLMIAEIDQEREALMSMFTGTIRRDTTEQTLTVCPEREVSNEVLFRFSNRLGLVDKDDLSGTPYYMTITDPHKTTRQKYDTPENKRQEGLYVNVPTTVSLTLSSGNHQLAQFQVPMAQFGFVTLRDASLFKRYVTHLQLSPVTGTIERLSADSEE